MGYFAIPSLRPLLLSHNWQSIVWSIPGKREIFNALSAVAKILNSCLSSGGFMEPSFVKENARERERLMSLVERLTDEELSLPVGDDWTIAIALAHLAFWDQRSLFLLRKWKKSGKVEHSPIDIDVTNDCLLPLWRALEPRVAANLAVSSAQEVDLEVEGIPPDLISKIESIGDKNRVYRSVHRKMHIDQIEDLLKKRSFR
jgi:hypothetical protein